MRIAEILSRNNEPPKRNRFNPTLDLPSAPFSQSIAKLANAFTRRGAVKHFWNLNGSEGQPSGPAPPEAGTELIPRGTLEPITASWQAEPVGKQPSVGQHRCFHFGNSQPVSLRPGNRGISQRRQRRCERTHEVSGRQFETIGCPSCSSTPMMM
jgi:hypothetical protein